MSHDAKKSFSPIEVQLEVGRQYYWCTCGRSQSQPFCDGTHKNTEFSPKAFSVDENRSAWLCTCKKTSNSPYCDGTHNKL
ncbi:CDGSH iron-sulfur domain-containing protein [Nitrosomonas aestuarii]|uniref:Iron-binding zinc finger CDGSH type n=1 Tax=Nitrosomonas aestuarii TaxID=52441 RepID=A0A1I3YNM1_9PROT|nr:CDGSH iron-sulfur domain-containing protein [Nitrosomonas aestuarii]PTN12637.1 iron-binding CDGSH zinc finger protein [Nitrosomonas aestuarii]SFK33375.1 Iron-binding zinc finger CDGSH type [Nitrosomonas aestuarii]